MEICNLKPSIKSRNFLVEHGIYIMSFDVDEIPIYKGLCNNNRLPVIAADCNSFWLAYVAYNEESYKSLLTPDKRIRYIFTVDKDTLKNVVTKPELLR